MIADNQGMIVDASTTEAEILADARAVVEAIHAGRRPDAALVSRIQRRSADSRQRLLQEHGTLNIAVPAIRELRDS